jgi:hypothetical protein
MPKLVAEIQTVSTQKCRSRMQGCRKRGRGNFGSTSAGLEKCQLFVPANLVLHAGALVKIEQIRATSKQNVLAVVHHFARTRMLIGRSAPSQIRTPFEQGDEIAGIRKRATGGESRESTTCDGNRRRIFGVSGIHGRHHTRRCRIPFPSTESFSGTVRRTLSLKTSYCLAAIFSSRRR